jgi:hypothetical protein
MGKHKLINRFNNNPNEEIHNSKEFRESSIYQHCRKISEEHSSNSNNEQDLSNGLIIHFCQYHGNLFEN